MSLEISFCGEIVPAMCQCHKGQSVVLAFFLHPSGLKVNIGHKIFETKDEAEKNMTDFILEKAKAYCELTGLPPIESASRVVIHDDDEALRAEQEYVRSNNPDLH